MGKRKYTPAPPPPKPAAPNVLDQALRLVGAAVLAIGAVTLAMPLLREIEHQLPAPGWVCWRVERSTAAGSERSTRCEPESGWSQEHWDGVGDVAVPPPWRRHWVRD